LERATNVTNAESGYMPVSGGKLYYEAAGAGEPLVFVHGFTLDTRMWDDQWDVFASKYRVVPYDVRGFGRSDLPGGAYANYIDLDAVVQHLGLQRPHVVGLSMGGGIAVDYAASFPDGLRSLTLIDSTLAGTCFPESFRAGVAFGPIAKERGVKAGDRCLGGAPVLRTGGRATGGAGAAQRDRPAPTTAKPGWSRPSPRSRRTPVAAESLGSIKVPRWSSSASATSRSFARSRSTWPTTSPGRSWSSCRTRGTCRTWRRLSL
jgi:pimeloyl-ACP methyl ester carboxylesterase